ncbi:Cell division cycle protein 123 [Dillenia turbinata]|uniref:Cell division cycle protein 123 n=1 Tax=Dillenia turbinata TaxID=194707 RepID=A0AAN8YVY4_9MAGN
MNFQNPLSSISSKIMSHSFFLFPSLMMMLSLIEFITLWMRKTSKSQRVLVMKQNKPPSPPSFPDVELKIKKSIETLGGAIFPKVNWSTPKDSAWISPTGNLRCSSFSEIALLLRASDSLVHDLCHAYDSCSDKSLSRPATYFLSLRKWYQSLRPEMEFHCFVRCHILVGISQREVTGFYPALLEEKNDIKALIEEFFVDNVRLQFESENYTFDVYVTNDRRVKLLDFNPWGAFTLPLHFSWDELEGNSVVGDGVEFRVLESQCTVRPGLKTAVPFDYLDTSPGSGWDQFLRMLRELKTANSSVCELGSLIAMFKEFCIQRTVLVLVDCVAESGFKSISGALLLGGCDAIFL